VEDKMRGEVLITAGVILIVAGILLTFIGGAITAGSQSKEKGEVKAAGVVMIGPIPIIFGSDRGMAITGVVLALILMIVAYLLFYR